MAAVRSTLLRSLSSFLFSGDAQLRSSGNGSKSSHLLAFPVATCMVLPAVVKVMKEESTLVTFVKPQFEARRSQVGKRGIVRDPAVHPEVREKVIKGVEELGFCKSGWIESPLKGADGITEFLVSFCRTSQEQGELSS